MVSPPPADVPPPAELGEKTLKLDDSIVFPTYVFSFISPTTLFHRLIHGPKGVWYQHVKCEKCNMITNCLSSLLWIFFFLHTISQLGIVQSFFPYRQSRTSFSQNQTICPYICQLGMGALIEHPQERSAGIWPSSPSSNHSLFEVSLLTRCKFYGLPLEKYGDETHMLSARKWMPSILDFSLPWPQRRPQLQTEPSNEGRF